MVNECDLEMLVCHCYFEMSPQQTPNGKYTPMALWNFLFSGMLRFPVYPHGYYAVLAHLIYNGMPHQSIILLLLFLQVTRCITSYLEKASSDLCGTATNVCIPGQRESSFCLSQAASDVNFLWDLQVPIRNLIAPVQEKACWNLWRC